MSAERRPTKTAQDVADHLSTVVSSIGERKRKEHQELQDRVASVFQKAVERTKSHADLGCRIDAPKPSDTELQGQIERAKAAAVARGSPAEKVVEAQVAASVARLESLARLEAATAVQEAPACDLLPCEATWESENWIHGGSSAATGPPVKGGRPREAARAGTLMTEAVRSAPCRTGAPAAGKADDEETPSPRKWGGC